MTNAPESAHSLLSRPFTTEEASKFGLSYRDLLREDVRHVSRELYIPGSEESSVADRLRAHLAVTPDAWGSHRTAAAIHGLWLPEGSSDHSRLHISRSANGQRVRRSGVIGHRVRALPDEIHEIDGGLRVTTPARTWLDLGLELGPIALVILGDQLVRRPRNDFEGRSEPYTTRTSLARMLKAHPNMGGVAKCREALTDMRVGADSVPETLLRLSLFAHHFPEPELQIKLHPSDPYSPSGDLGYRIFKVVIQYDGAHHLTEEQRLRDARRDSAFRAAGWIVIIVTAADMRDDFARVRAELRLTMAKRAA